MRLYQGEAQEKCTQRGNRFVNQELAIVSKKVTLYNRCEKKKKPKTKTANLITALLRTMFFNLLQAHEKFSLRTRASLNLGLRGLSTGEGEQSMQCRASFPGQIYITIFHRLTVKCCFVA